MPTFARSVVRLNSRFGVAFASLAGSCAALLVGAASARALPPVPQPAENPITENKRVLGKILFWDEQLSTADTVSCGTCHRPGKGGTDTRIVRAPGRDLILNNPDDIFTSPGVINSNAANDFQRDPVYGLNPQLTTRATNGMINAAYSPDLFWDGRATSRFIDPETGAVAIQSGGALESQCVQPPVGPVEMAHASTSWPMLTAKLAGATPLALATALPSDVAAALASKPSYPVLFQRAFGDPTISARRIAFALATYERTLISDQTPLDRYQSGISTALTANQLNGMQLFLSASSNCSACHNGQLFTNQSYRNIGLRPSIEDMGRQVVTGLPQDRGRFKVPNLRNVGLKSTFMHNGQFSSLTQVVNFYARLGGAPPQVQENLDPAMGQIFVLPGNVPPIVDFLTNGLTDPRVAAQTFPFDKPLMFTERVANQPTVVGGGVAGSGGVVAQILVPSPPFLGNPDFRVGLDGALAGAGAQLAISSAAPVGGVINIEYLMSPRIASGSGNAGLATEHLYLNPRQFRSTGVYYMQWLIADAAAPGGVARSAVARVPIFCGSYGCPGPCSPADIADDAGNYLAPYLPVGATAAANSGVNEGDYNAFFNGFFDAYVACDIADDAGIPLGAFGPGGVPGANNGVNEGDYNCFFNTFFQGC
ncbi:hypothetical protein BH11PLA1_BH11PLA1_23450 [soil metagenome]